MKTKILKAHLFKMMRVFIVSFLFMLGLFKVMQDAFIFVDYPASAAYVLAILVAVWNTVEAVKEIRKSSTQPTE